MLLLHTFDCTLFIAAIGLGRGLVTTALYRLFQDKNIDMAPSLHWPVPQVICSITPHDDRQVLIQIEYIIDTASSDKFGCAIRELKNLLHDGATNLGIFYDVANTNRYVESFRAESWMEHLRFHERFTKNYKEIVLAFHIGKVAPVVNHFIDASMIGDDKRS